MLTLPPCLQMVPQITKAPKSSWFEKLKERKLVKSNSLQGEEFHFILSGKVELTYGDKHFVFEKGDFVYFDGDVPYSGRSLGSQPATIFMGQYHYKRDYRLPFSNLDVLSANAVKTNGG
jgi:hypothetical protein